MAHALITGTYVLVIRCRITEVLQNLPQLQLLLDRIVGVHHTYNHQSKINSS
jgi:hypothetical protein